MADVTDPAVRDDVELLRALVTAAAQEREAFAAMRQPGAGPVARTSWHVVYLGELCPAVAKARAGGMTLTAIGRIVGCSPASVKTKLRAVGYVDVRTVERDNAAVLVRVLQAVAAQLRPQQNGSAPRGAREPMTSAHQLSVFIPREMREQLIDRARDNERSLSAEVRLALRRHLETA